jgi:PhnB protein
MPTVRLNPYLNFRDSARDALGFYHSVFGGDVSMMTYGQNGMPHEPAEADKIMHGQLDAPGGMILMIADVPNSMPFSDGGNVSISLSGDDEAAMRGYWDKLLAGGQTTVPLEKAPWGDTFGMLTDKFGIAWLVNIAGQH